MARLRNRPQKFFLGGLGGDYTPIAILIFIMILQPLKSQIIGNTSQLHQHSQLLQVSSGEDNQIVGFTDLLFGLSLQDEQTTCTYNATFGIRHILDLQGGSLYLDSDLELKHPMRIPAAGKVFGNGYALQFPRSTKTLRLPETSAGKSFTPLLTTKTYADIGGIDWSFDNQFVVFGTQRKGRCSHLQIQELVGAGFKQRACHEMAESIRCVRWHPNDYIVAFGTKASPRQDALHVFRFDPKTDKLLPCQSTGLFKKHVYAISWHPSGKYLAVASKTRKEEIIILGFDGTGFYKVCSTGFGVQKAVVDGALSWDPMGKYLAVGIQKSSRHPELAVYFFDKNRIVCADCADMNRSIEALDWSPDGQFLAVGMSDGKRNEKLTAFHFDRTTDTLTCKDPVRSGQTAAIHSVQWSVDGKYLATAKQFDVDEPQIALYTFDKRVGQFRLIERHNVAHGVCRVRWSPDGRHIVTGEECSRSSLYRVTDAFTLDTVHCSFYSDVTLSVPIELYGDSSFHGDGHTMEFLDTAPLRLHPGSCMKIQDATLLFDDAGFVLDPGVSHLQIKDCTLISKDNLSAVGGNVELAGEVCFVGKHSYDAQVSDGSNLILNGATTLTNTWNIYGNVRLNGNGNVLDMSQGGVLNVASGATFELNGVVLKGCNDATFVCADDTSQINLSHVTLEMNDDITMTTGKVNVCGPATVIVKGHTFTFDADAHLTVDGIVLWQDWAGSNVQGSIDCAQPFQDHCSLLNSATIRTVGIDAVIGINGGYYDLVLANSQALMKHNSIVYNHEGQLNSIDTGPNNVTFKQGGDTYISYDMHLSPQHKLHFTQNTVFDGMGHTLHCVHDEVSIVLDANVSVTLKNCVLSQMSESSVSFGSGACLTLGDGTIWRNNNGLVLNRVWNIEDTAVIDGRWSFLIFATNGRLSVGKNSLVELANMKIGSIGNNLNVVDDTGTYRLRDVVVIHKKDASFVGGTLVIEGLTSFEGPAVFSFKSNADLRIAPHSTLRFSHKGIFAFEPKNGNTTSLKMFDKTSVLELDDATLRVGAGGLYITRGTLLVPSYAALVSLSTSPQKSVIFGNDNPAEYPTIDIRQGARFEIADGSVSFW